MCFQSQSQTIIWTTSKVLETTDNFVFAWAMIATPDLAFPRLSHRFDWYDIIAYQRNIRVFGDFVDVDI